MSATDAPLKPCAREQAPPLFDDRQLSFIVVSRLRARHAAAPLTPEGTRRAAARARGLGRGLRAIAGAANPDAKHPVWHEIGEDRRKRDMPAHLLATFAQKR
jgi:hypothetical protein